VKQDPYSYPGTNVLRNLPGIKDPEQLAEFEYDMASLREIQQTENPIRGYFDLKHLQGIHKELFKDVYDWAGEIRTVGISKGGSSFAPPALIEQYGNSTVFADLKKDNFLQGMEKEKLVERLSHHFSEINALHPFREGNGRATRVFITELVKQTGHSIDFDNVDPNAWIKASRASFVGQMGPIQDIFRDNITSNQELDRSEETFTESEIQANLDRAVAFQTLPMKDTLERYPELEGAYSDLKIIAEGMNPNLPQAAQDSMYAVAKETITLDIARGEIPESEQTRVAENEIADKEIRGREGTDREAPHEAIHTHAVKELGRHYGQVRDNPDFHRHDKDELAKVAYFRGVYEKNSEFKGETPNFQAYDAKMANRETLRQLPEPPALEVPENVKPVSRERAADDDLSL
jgi:cell filamentation protein